MPAPTRFGRYLLLERLAVGGMAEIFLAKVTGDGGFERLCVIKRVLPHLGRDPEFIRMFLDEARLAAQLHHPGIVQIHELGRVGDDYFIAMEYLAGDDLSSVILQSRRASLPVPVEVAVQVIASAAGALHSAHEHRDPGGHPLRIVHRDVSPSNLFVTFHGAVKVLDFGVARAEGRLAATGTGGTKGKLSYMSPEQALGREVDRRTDVWALGLCLRELLTGVRLFSGGGATLERVRRICSEPIPPASALRPDVPPDLERILQRALTRDPERRHPTAEALRRDLEGFLAARPSSDAVDLADYLHRLFGEAHVRARSTIATGDAAPLLGTAPLATAALAAPAASGTARLAPPPGSAAPATPTTTFWTAPQLQPASPSAVASGDGPGERTAALRVSAPAAIADARVPDLERTDVPRRSTRAGLRWAGTTAAVLVLSAAALLFVRVRAGALVEPPLATLAGAAPASDDAPGKTTTAPVDRHAVQAAEVPEGPADLALPAPDGDTPDTEPSSADTSPSPSPARASSPNRRRATAARKQERRSAATGRLTVHANVPVEVFLGARKLGSVPLNEVQLPAGRHVLRLVDTAHGLSRKVPIRIEAGQTTEHRAALGTGTLNVDAVPWAEVSIDGTPRGLTPIAGLVLWEGDHRVRLAGPEHTRVITVRIRKGQVTAVRESLAPTAAVR